MRDHEKCLRLTIVAKQRQKKMAWHRKSHRHFSLSLTLGQSTFPIRNNVDCNNSVFFFLLHCVPNAIELAASQMKWRRNGMKNTELLFLHHSYFFSFFHWVVVRFLLRFVRLFVFFLHFFFYFCVETTMNHQVVKLFSLSRVVLEMQLKSEIPTLYIAND